MTDRQVQLVKQSWQLIKPVSRQAGLIFYEKLFTAAPGIRHLFKHDMSSQADKLTVMLDYTVQHLDKPEDMIAAIQQPGARHNQYGALPEHYDLVGNCIISTLKSALTDKWNEELQKAWVAAFTILKNAMVAAQLASSKQL